MFEGRPYRGSLEFLQWYVNITVHCTALLIRLEPSRQLDGWPDEGLVTHTALSEFWAARCVLPGPTNFFV